MSQAGGETSTGIKPSDDNNINRSARTLSSFCVKAPGRICLFGEHSDYLGFPVIARAIPLYCSLLVKTELTSEKDDTHTIHPNVIIHLHVPPELGPSKVYDVGNLPYSPPSSENDSVDFALAAIHEVLKEGWDLTSHHRFDSESDVQCSVYDVHCWSSSGELPLQAGCSSSTAFLVAWVLMLAKLADQDLQPLQLAQLAHRAEVTHFGHPGGTMDHVSIALGTTISHTIIKTCGAWRIGPDLWEVKPLPVLRDDESDNGMWILADSGEPKDTLKHLRRCKHDRLQLLREKLRGDWDCCAPSEMLTDTEQNLWKTTLINRDTEHEATKIWSGCDIASPSNSVGQSLALLMKRHHEALRDGLGLSTMKLETINKAALDAGAWGFKVVGSGGGGCGVAWTSADKAEEVAQAMKKAGAKATWIFNSKNPVLGAHVC
ncbi:galactokinase [Nitzschia inconspicua]|uniref:Galactokinase n=1 Tax=Nitzschia inconspicua TaxID=303405 RepID=A0A9K3LUI4_9STRA|nr:galactokinase [Nitzschia inconspicua]